MDVTLDKDKQEEKQTEQEQKKVRHKKESSDKRRSGIGLDVGTMTIISAIMKDEDTSYKVERDAFFAIENNKMSKSMLDKMNTNYVEAEDKKHLYVVGEESLAIANFFNQEIRRPLSQGVISTREKESLTLIKILLKLVLGDPIEEGEICHYSVPAIPLDANYNIVYYIFRLQTYTNE